MFILCEENSIANHFIAELRSKDVQQDSMRFRRNLERVGEILAYEISKKLEFKSSAVATPLGTATIPILPSMPVLATILRAGIPFYQGFLNYFDKSGSAFIAAYRSNEGEMKDIEIKMEYSASPSLENKVLILIDPMLATGKSSVVAYKSLLNYGKPSAVHIASVIASKPAIAYLEENLDNFTLWTGAVDNELNSKSYIVPGLGDAGDLSFGVKL